MSQRWMIFGGIGGLVLVLVAGVSIGALAFAGGSSNSDSRRAASSIPVSPSPSAVTTQTALPSFTSAPVVQAVATNIPLVTPQLVVATQQPAQPTQAPIVPTLGPAATDPPLATIAPTLTFAPTAAPTSAPTAIPAPTPRPTPAITWPEVAQGFLRQENSYYDSVKTYQQITLPLLGTLTYTNQFNLTSCAVQSWNNSDWAWIIQCDIEVLVVTPGFQPEHDPQGTGLFKLFADTGNVVQL